MTAQSAARAHKSFLPPHFAGELMKLFQFVNVAIRFVLTVALGPQWFLACFSKINIWQQDNHQAADLSQKN